MLDKNLPGLPKAISNIRFERFILTDFGVEHRALHINKQILVDNKLYKTRPWKCTCVLGGNIVNILDNAAGSRMYTENSIYMRWDSHVNYI